MVAKENVVTIQVAEDIILINTIIMDISIIKKATNEALASLVRKVSLALAVFSVANVTSIPF